MFKIKRPKTREAITGLSYKLFEVDDKGNEISGTRQQLLPNTVFEQRRYRLSAYAKSPAQETIRAGYASFKIDEERMCYLSYLNTDEEFRNCGVGSGILNQLLAAVSRPNSGMKAIAWSSLNRRSDRFYANFFRKHKKNFRQAGLEITKKTLGLLRVGILKFRPYYTVKSGARANCL